MGIDQQQPKNLFLTKHFLSVIGVFYVSSVSPAIDRYIEGTLSKQDVGHLATALVATIFGASIKGLEDNIYTPKGIIGKNKDELIQPLVSTTLVETKELLNSPLTTITTSVLDNKDNITTNAISNILDSSSLSIDSNPVTAPIIRPDTNLTITTKQETYFKVRPVDSSSLKYNEKMKIEANNVTHILSYELDRANNHTKFVSGNKIWYAYTPHITVLKDNTIVDEFINTSTGFIPTIEQCNTLYGTRLTDAEYKDFVNCLATFNITTKLDVAHFMAQTAHESGGLRYMKEIGDYDYFTQNYEGREDLGNTESGDGAKYAGAGVLQLTGRANYTSFSKYVNDIRVVELGQEYVANTYPFSSGGWFWKTNDLSNYINNEGADVLAVTKVINGGTNGLEQRQEYFDKACRIFDIYK